MNLYEVPRNSRIRLADGLEVNFHHVDGMYSLCKTDAGEIMHLAAWTDVDIVNPTSSSEGEASES